jgi:hypothetical protein
MTQDVEGQGTSGGNINQPNTSLSAEIMSKCIEIMERYRSGIITKVTAILRLQSILPHNIKTTYREALGAYIRVLDNFERIRERPIPGGDLAGSRERDAGSDEEGREENSIRQNKRSRTQSPGSDDISTRRKIDVNLFAWVICDGIDPPSLSPSLMQTQTILENFSRDPKLAKSSLHNSARLPQFPDSEWANLIAGRAVDLDHVLAAQYSIAHDERWTERIGELEVVVGSTKPARVVDTHGKWVIAWDQAVDATTYIFPHRSTELRDYGRHISQLFTSFPDSLHTQVIQYDRAIRIRTAQQQDLLLTDFHRFTDLHVLWIQNAGAARSRAGDDAKRTRNGGSSGGTKRREVCRRWNEGHCPNSVASCSYAHVCAKCRSNAHTTTECKQ